MSQSPKVVVSMTTIASRIDKIAQTIKSVLAGNKQPDRFVLYLGDQPFGIDTGVTHIPSELTTLPVEIRWTRNIGPACKLLPALQDYQDAPDTMIATIDDDMWYPPRWLQNLVAAAEQTPDTTICYLARQPRFRKGKLRRYIEWGRIAGRNTPLKRDFVPLGNYGILVRPKFFRPDVFDTDTMLELAPRTDDLWFAATKVAGHETRVLKSPGPIRMTRPGGPSLYDGGNGCQANKHGGNDLSAAALAKQFPGQTPWE